MTAIDVQLKMMCCWREGGAVGARGRACDVELDIVEVDVGAFDDGDDALAHAAVEPVGGPGLPEAQVHARPAPPPRAPLRRMHRLPRLHTGVDPLGPHARFRPFDSH